jgi:hypothetical protein
MWNLSKRIAEFIVPVMELLISFSKNEKIPPPQLLIIEGADHFQVTDISCFDSKTIRQLI